VGEHPTAARSGRPAGPRRVIRAVSVPWFALLAVAVLLAATRAPLVAQPRFTIAEFLSSAFPYELVSATSADRIAWLELERGMRNVYTAAAPDFRAVRLTAFESDDGRDLSGLQISADGSVVVFVRGHRPNRDGWVANPASDPRGAERAAWAVRTSGGEPWRIAEAVDPRLSPDGRWIVYAKGGQIHRAPVDPRALVDFDADAAPPLVTAFGRNGDPVWAPDSRRIAFVSDRGDHSFIGVYDDDGGTVRYLAPGVDRDGGPAWSPDGGRIAFVRQPGLPFAAARQQPPAWAQAPVPEGLLPDGMRRSGFAGGHTLEIWVADARTGEGGRLWHSWPGERRFTDVRTLDWVGEHLVFRSEPGEHEWQRYAISTRSPAREPVWLTSNGGFAEHTAYSADGRWLYFTSNAGDVDRRHVWRVPVAGGSPEQLTRGDGIETFPAPLASGRHLALLAAGARQPQSVAVVDAGGGTPRVIRAQPAGFPAGAHVVPRNVVITSEDGVAFHSQLFLPPDLRPGERRPALIFIHGGPRRQMLLGYHYGHFYHSAYAMNQYFASRGYVTLSINFRSGIGYGTAFRDWPDYGRRGNTEYRDVYAAGRWLQDRADVDPERIGLWGLSYGGILTAQGLARNSDLFRAGVDIAGVHLYGDADDPESTLFRSSAVAAIGTWRSPVLLVHGDDDRNVAFSQTVGLVQLLRAHGVPHELIVFPDDVHDFLLHSRWLRTFEAMDDFFRRTLGGRAAAWSERH
jgi:dipeptidyl-peptidase-4